MSLWRIDGAAHLVAGDAARLVAGLRRHLSTAPIQSLVVQIGQRQQEYVLLHGCSGCVTSRHVVGCRADFLDRSLRATAGAQRDLVGMRLVRNGLAPQAYRRYLVAWPTPRATAPLSASLVAGWPLARIVATWAPGPPFHVAAVIALGGDEDGPVLAPRLAEMGWAGVPVPKILHYWVSDIHRGSLGALRRAPWAADPWLLLSQPQPQPPIAHGGPSPSTMLIGGDL